MWQIIVGAFFLICGISAIAEDIAVFLVGVLLGIILIIWGLQKKRIIDIRKLITGKEAPVQSLVLHAVGSTYYESAFRSLEIENAIWNKSAKEILAFGKADHRIYRYNYMNTPVVLTHEPNNPNDPNALAIHVAGRVVGYIGREQNSFVLGLLKQNRIKTISCFIGGGEYKVISADGSTTKFETGNSVTINLQYQ